MSARRAWARLSLAAAAVVVGLTLSAAPASAHAVLIGSNPADGSSLDSAPQELVLTFDEAVTVESTVVHLLDESGRTLEVGAIAAGDGSGEEEAEAISAQLPQLPERPLSHPVADDHERRLPPGRRVADVRGRNRRRGHGCRRHQ